ncbi:MAG TPA: hypothetical protein VFN61_08195 [Acidimicrobiales bacterium]|nr:hypothetical protein [Acidimicrobiales bacterium]
MARQDTGYLLWAQRRVLATGAGSGIGLATAVSLARAGPRTWGLVPDDNEARALSQAPRDSGLMTLIGAQGRALRLVE